MNYGFIGDLHLGYKRKSFTSTASGQQYASQILRHAYKAATAVTTSKIIQVGDIFHKFRDSDATLMDGIGFCRQMDVVVVGNHDISNTLSNGSTMDMCSKLSEYSEMATKYIFPDKNGEESVSQFTDQNSKVKLTVVPYCYTQEQFLLSLTEAENVKKLPGWSNILVLHTNYNLSYDLTETTINLTKDRAKELLEKYDYIISGHEHNYSTHFKGRLIMTGSVFPISTAELKDKYAHVFDTTTREFTKKRIWDASQHAISYDIGSLPTEIAESIQFITITGKANATTVAAAQKTITGWWRDSNNLLVCKPEYEVTTQARKSVSTVKTDMVSHIRGLLKPPAKKLLDTMVEELNDE